MHKKFIESRKTYIHRYFVIGNIVLCKRKIKRQNEKIKLYSYEYCIKTYFMHYQKYLKLFNALSVVFKIDFMHISFKRLKLQKFILSNYKYI